MGMKYAGIYVAPGDKSERMDELNEAAVLRAAKREGYKEGFREAYEEGKRLERIEIAKNLLRMNGISLEEITRVTELSMEEVRALQDEM